MEDDITIEKNQLKIYFENGNKFLNDNEPSKALECFLKILKIDPENIDAINGKGISLLDLRKYDEAGELFDILLEKEPQNIDFLNNKGLSLLESEKYENSIQYFDHALELKSDYIYAIYNKGRALYCLNKLPEALKYFENVLEIDNKNLWALIFKGDVLQDLNKSKEALLSYEKALKIDPELGDAWYQKGKILHKHKRDKEALEAYKKFVEYTPPYLKVEARRVKEFINNYGKKKVALSPPEEPQFWQWVTRSEYFLEADGSERESLEPGDEDIDIGGWWTCHKDTRIGDLILLYRAGQKGGNTYQDIKYLIQATSDAYSIVEDVYAFEHGWQYGCDYRPLFKFKNSFKLDEMKKDPYLDEWNALKGNFNRSVYKTENRHWERLIDVLKEKNPDFIEFFKTFNPEKSIIPKQTEAGIEKALIKQIGILNNSKRDLELVGNQVVCKGDGGRIDVLCRNKKNNGFVVIELKIVKATRNTFGQISNYMGWVIGNCADGNPVDGLVISKGYDNKFSSALKTTDKVEHLELSELLGHLGLKLT